MLQQLNVVRVWVPFNTFYHFVLSSCDQSSVCSLSLLSPTCLYIPHMNRRDDTAPSLSSLRLSIAKNKFSLIACRSTIWLVGKTESTHRFLFLKASSVPATEQVGRPFQSFLFLLDEVFFFCRFWPEPIGTQLDGRMLWKLWEFITITLSDEPISRQVSDLCVCWPPNRMFDTPALDGRRLQVY